MSRQRRRSRSRKEGAPVFYMIATAVFIASIIGLVGFSVHLRQSEVKLDEVTLCPRTKPPRAFVLLIDVTDGVNEIQKKSIDNQIEKLRETMRIGDLIEVYSIGSGDDLLTPRLRLCRPESGADVSILTGNVETAEEVFETKFEQPFLTLFDELLAAPAATSSPIMRGIQAAVVSGFGTLPETSERHLIVVSDMLEYDGERSHYQRDGIDPQTLDDPGFARVSANMTGVRAEIWYIRRTLKSGEQGADHILFWEAYFAKQKGSLERVIQVEG